MNSRKVLGLLACLVLLLWGGLFIQFYVSGRIQSHVDVSFRTWALIAGLGLCVVGLFNLATLRRKDVCTHDHDHDHAHSHDGDSDHACCDHDHDHGHDHSHHHDHSHEEHDHGHDHEPPASAVLTAIVILTVPLLMAARFSEDQFSADYLQKWGKIERQIYQMRMAERRKAKAEERAAQGPTVASNSTSNADSPPSPDGSGGTDAADTPPSTDDTGGDEWGAFTMEDLERMVPKNSAGQFLLDVPQIFYTAGDEELMDVMEGIPVETVAQVMEETLHNPNGHRLKLFRLFVECCAADARPLSIPIDFGAPPPAYEELGWVKVIGNLHYAEEDGDIVPILRVETMEPTAEPMDMMMY